MMSTAALETWVSSAQQASAERRSVVTIIQRSKLDRLVYHQ
jgi:hypothetical protein